MFSRSLNILPILILAGLWAAFAACDDAAAQLNRRMGFTSGVLARARERTDRVFGEGAYCVDGWCTPNVIEFGYYPAQWRRWPSTEQKPGDGVKRLPDDIRPVDEPNPLDEMSTSITHPKRSDGAADAPDKDAGRSKSAAKPSEGSKPESSDLLETLDKSASVDPPPGLPGPLGSDSKKTTAEAEKKAVSKIALAAATAKEELTGKDKTAAKQNTSGRPPLNRPTIKVSSDKTPVADTPAPDAGSIRRASATVTLEKDDQPKAPLVWNGNPLRRSTATSNTPAETSPRRGFQPGRNPLRSN